MTHKTERTISDYKKADFIWDIKYRVSTFLTGYPRELLLYAKHLFYKKKQTPKIKFAIFSTGRSGSTLLLSLLNSQADLFCDGEILKHRFFSPFNVLKTHAEQADAQIYGFKLMTHHIQDVQLSAKKDGRAFLKKLIAEGYKIIYLERENRLNQSLSMMYAILRNDWHRKKGKKSLSETMAVDLDQLDTWMSGFDKLNEYEKNLLTDIPHIHLVYEKDLANNIQHEKTIRKVCDFLHIPVVKPDTNLQKITPKQHGSFISNVSEVHQHLSGTKYAHLLETSKPEQDSETNLMYNGRTR